MVSFIGRPDAPTNWPMPLDVQSWMLGVGFAITALLLAAGVANLLRRRDPWILLLMGVGVLTLPLEGAAEFLGKCLMPTIGQIQMYVLLGKHVPLYVLPMFQLYLVVNVILMLKIFRAHLSTAKFFALYFALVGACIFFGLAWIKLGILRYYGNQPLLVFGEVPVWVAFLDISLGYWAAAIFYWFKYGRSPPRPAFVIVIAPPLLISLYMGSSLPIAWALYSGQDAAINIIGALGTISVSVVFTGLAYKIKVWVDQGRGEPA